MIVKNMRDAVRQAVIDLKDEMKDEGANPNIDKVDYDRLLAAVQDEYAGGGDGSIYEVVIDLHETVGLAEFGFIEDEES